MSFSMYESGGRNRRRMSERRRKVILIIFAISIVCGFFFWWGGENVRTSEVAYKQRALTLQEEKEVLERTITSLTSDVKSAQVRYQQMEAKYLAEVPQGGFKAITDIVKKQLDSGIKPARLSFVIESARPPKNCVAPQAKRFVVKTPVYSGPHGTVAFGNGAITVTGEGQSAMGPTGGSEAWYDPGKTVKITFIEIGGKETVKESLLPIQHSMVLGNKEYRFTVAAGERSFISVTSDNCDYP